MSQLAFSTNAFKKHSLTEAINAIADIGYRGVEIMADVPHALPETFGRAQRDALKAQLRERSLVVSNVNAFTLFAHGDTYHPTWIEDDLKRRDIRINHTLACIELAAELGAKTVSLQPGGPLIGTGLTRDEASRRFADGLNRVLELARRYNVILAIEPEPGLLIQTSDEYAQFKSRYCADDPSIRMNCDIGHLFCVGEDPAAVIRRMPGEVAHLHLEDIGKNRVHQHLTPGKGVIDFPCIFAALHDIGYNGWVTVELYPYETTAAGVARRAWEHLQQIL